MKFFQNKMIQIKIKDERRIKKGEAQIKKGRLIKVSDTLSDEEIDARLMR